METQEPPEFTRIVELLQDSGLKEKNAVELAERMSNIASQNTIAQFGSELRAGLEGLRAELTAQRESQEARIDSLRESQEARIDIFVHYHMRHQLRCRCALALHPIREIPNQDTRCGIRGIHILIPNVFQLNFPPGIVW